MKPQHFGWAVVSCALLLGACQQGKNSSNDDDEEAPPVPVETSLPVRGDIYAVYSGTAPIEAYAEADVIAKVEGEIREILVEEGDDVSKGQTMARLDGDRLRLELNESQARLRKLQRDFQRNRELQEKGLISQGDFEKIQYELEALEASNNLASLQLNYTQIRAPIDGVVSQRFVKRGNMARVGDRLFRVTSLDPLVAYLFAPEGKYKHLAPGQPVVMEVDALRGERFFAEVTRVSPVIDSDTGTFKITVEISDPGRRVKPGMFARISIVYDRHENALQVPRPAIVGNDEDISVFVVEDGVAVRKPVQAGFSEQGMIEITAGLTDDEHIITVGQVGLKDGSKVTVINAAPESTDSSGSDAQETDNAPTD
ncbi:MAG: efflux RND transporter periplasmic adaptor subunit [Gammaproteobacteria bacterium]|nr:efflux RND transporter periplasmic adaptor subunit [Gammaproteobacteria bacterium]MBU2675480.1 efflux RND transporter periplasmic adaptor subunit [Gammaproteobacteria bacterium]NNL49215.1 efflux RND transporter periplasmic adaptor subunit [Woeseiaceae bacterium]